MSCKKAQHFMLAFVPDQQEDIHAFNHHTDEFDEHTGLFHEWDADLPSCVVNIKAALTRAGIKPEAGDQVVAYALVPIREYEVIEESGFNLVLQGDLKKKKGDKK
ncbi:MAG: hypothetical protein V3V32_05390 [Dehalococcoidia bacterium]